MKFCGSQKSCEYQTCISFAYSQNNSKSLPHLLAADNHISVVRVHSKLRDLLSDSQNVFLLYSGPMNLW